MKQKPNKVFLLRNLDGDFAAAVLAGSVRGAWKQARYESGMTVRQLRASGWRVVRLKSADFEVAL